MHFSPDDNWFDLCLVKATNPLAKEEGDQALETLVDTLMKKKEFISTALQFLAHKIQSPQELEAMKSLEVLEYLVSRCDSKFTSEVAKFKFLNELIKVVSPKYLASRSSKKVKNKIFELLFKWSVEYHEPKMYEAYQMLKKQGLITNDPLHAISITKSPPPPTPRPKDEIFDKEENALTLQRLLRSQNPDDLVAANLMIKVLTMEKDKKNATEEKCKLELDVVQNNVRVLSDLLAVYQPSKTTQEDLDLMKELYDSCEQLRPRLFRIAADIDEKNPLVKSILVANDQLTSVLNEYKSKIESKDKPAFKPEQSNNLVDIFSPTHEKENVDVCLLSDLSTNCSEQKTNFTTDLLTPRIVSQEIPTKQKSNHSSLYELESLMRETFTTQNFSIPNSSKISLNELKIRGDEKATSKEKIESSLTDLFVPLDSIKPSSTPPIHLLEENGLKTVANFGKDSPREGVTVIVITITNCNEKNVTKVFFQLVDYERNKFKLQAPSATSLPGFNPFLPPPAITQVLLLSKPVMSLKFRLDYSLESENFSKTGIFTLPSIDLLL